jgi:hypothetical protein|tara:strand:- start:463 stop:591 length:129 start_codon:yes stop_codon:yes gene_type:complete
MGKDLTDTERAIIQQAILDRWNPLRLNKNGRLTLSSSSISPA